MTHDLRGRLAEQIKRGELAEAAGQTQQAARYSRLAEESRQELAARGAPDAGATARIEAGYGNPARCCLDKEESKEDT